MNNSKKTRSILIMLTGLPGAGKSTLAAKIQQTFTHHTTQILQADAIRKTLFPTPTYSAEESTQTHAEVRRLVLLGLRTHDIVIYDATNMLQAYRAWGDEAATSIGAQALVVAAVAAEAVVKARLDARQQDPAQLSDANYAIYQLLAKTAEPIAGDHVVVRCEDGFFADDFERLRVRLHQMLGGAAKVPDSR